MKKNTGLFIWLCAGIAGAAIFVSFFGYAFPVASIDIRLNKEQVLAKATDFAERHGFDVSGFDRTILFDSDGQASIYLQKTQGIKKANAFIRQGLPVWFWSVRWFKELDKEGFFCAVDPATGATVAFEHFLFDDAPGDNLSIEEAREKAQEEVRQQGILLEEYALKEETKKQQKNRTDYFFVWEKKNYAIEEARLRISMAIYGNSLGHFSRYLDIPEEFTRGLQKELSFGQVLSLGSVICMFMIFIAAIVILILQFKKDGVKWRFALVFGVIVTVLTVVDFINSIPLLWGAYPDTMSKAVFVSISAASAFIGALLVGLAIFVFGGAGEALSREVWHSKLPFVDAIRKGEKTLLVLMRPFLAGYALAFVFLGYITLFYLCGTKFFHIWMPPEAEYSNIIGTSLPFLFPLTIAVSAAISEEFAFRLFSISLLKKYLKSSWVAVLLPAMIWAFAHSNYPVFPVYVRGIELTVAGIVFGIVFLRYGLETVIIAHYVIDALLVALPLLKSHNAYFVSSGAAVIALAFLPLVLVPIIGRRAVPEPQN